MDNNFAYFKLNIILLRFIQMAIFLKSTLHEDFKTHQLFIIWMIPKNIVLTLKLGKCLSKAKVTFFLDTLYNIHTPKYLIPIMIVNVKGFNLHIFLSVCFFLFSYWSMVTQCQSSNVKCCDSSEVL